MSNFIVLGLIPGTNTQLTFTIWLLVAAPLFVLLVVRTLSRTRALRYNLLGLRMLFAARRWDV